MAETLTDERFKVVRCFDPNIWINELREYIIESGSTNATVQSYTATNYNNNQLSFSFVTPSPDVVMDRKMYVCYQVQMQDVNPLGSGSGVNPSQSDFVSQLEGPRIVPLHSASTSVQCSMNGTSFSWTPDKLIAAMLRYYKLEKGQADTMCPLLGDQLMLYQYSDGKTPAGAGIAGRSPFAPYQNGFPMWNLTSRNLYNFGGSVSPPSATLNNNLTVSWGCPEPVILPPLEFGAHCQSPGLFGVSSFTLNYNFDPTRFWTSGVFDNTSTAGGLIPRNMQPGQQINGVLSSQSNLFVSAPTLVVKYYTLPNSFPRPLKVSYPFYQIDSYITSSPVPIGGSAPGSAGTSAPITTPTILLNTIPHRMYFCAKRALTPAGGITNNQQWSFNSPAYTDTFGLITNMSITFNNQSGVLSTTDFESLYFVCVKNGLEDVSWLQFTGGVYQGYQKIYFSDLGLGLGSSAIDYNRPGPGSVICLTPAELCLDESFVSGSLGRFSIQANLKVINPLSYLVNYDVYTIVVSEGITTYDTSTGLWSKAVGVVSSAEVLSATIGAPSMLKSNLNMFGGSIFSKIGNFAHKALNIARAVAPHVREALSHPLAQAALKEASHRVGRHRGSGYQRGRSRSRRHRGGAALESSDLI